MNSRVTTVAAAIVLALAAGQGSAESVQDFSGAVSPDAFGCTYNFSATAIKWCLSSTGNLQKLESPAGAEHIAAGVLLEGYLICVNNVPTYWDTAVRLGGWGNPSVIAGPTSSSVTIRRVTSDGKFTLDQKWSRDSTERDLTVQMTLVNSSAAAIPSVKLIRIVDIDANATYPNNADKTRYGTWIRGTTDAVAVSPLTLSGAPFTAVTDFTTADTLPLTCSPSSLPMPNTAVGDYAAWVVYDFGSISAGSKKIVKIGYQVL